jgi:hypothetical protein
MRINHVPLGDHGPTIEMRFTCTGCRCVIVRPIEQGYEHGCGCHLPAGVRSLATYWPDMPPWCPKAADSYRELVNQKGELWETRRQPKSPQLVNWKQVTTKGVEQ